MGNWRTVNIIGTCNASELDALRAACHPGEDYENFHPLSFLGRGSLCGLNDWPAEKISVIGNLAKGDYDAQDVAKACLKLIVAAPSLSLKIHCGGDYESLDCVATVTVHNGLVSIGEPEVKTLMAIPSGQMTANLLRALGGR